jgi:hypothetical protein
LAAGVVPSIAQEANMKLTVTHQEKYSRGQLLLRLFFGLIYIGIPHLFLLFFVSIWSAILSFVTFWVCLFTGKFPESIFTFQVKVQNWGLRVSATLSNLVDGYPAFFPSGTSDSVKLEVPHPAKVSRGLVIVRLLFGAIYVGIPHGFCLWFREIGTMVLSFLAWWAVLFTGKYPARWHAFNVGTFRWLYRVSLYLGYFTDEYPKFSGKE